MSPLLTGLAKLTREELDALFVEHERLKRHERERIMVLAFAAAANIDQKILKSQPRGEARAAMLGAEEALRTLAMQLREEP